MLVLLLNNDFFQLFHRNFIAFFGDNEAITFVVVYWIVSRIIDTDLFRGGNWVGRLLFGFKLS